MLRSFLPLLLLALFTNTYAQQPIRTPNIQGVLYLGEGEDQPLIVGLGGSEGGNAWASDRWKETRDSFLNKGYAFLALAYFGSEGTPALLNKIAIEDVFNAIAAASQKPKVSKTKIAIVGGSRGADLALLIASYYKEISCVVAIVPSHAVFPGHTREFTTSCFTFNGKELPFVPVNEEAVPFLINSDLRGAFEAMLKDTIAEQKALINIGNINGPILFLSATKDEICPSTPMSIKMMETLKAKKFNFHFEHLAIDGRHGEPLKHFGKVRDFLEIHFK
jgi:pimeloyl-ACP methyl ester carboxylesterase